MTSHVGKSTTPVIGLRIENHLSFIEGESKTTAAIEAAPLTPITIASVSI